MFKSWNKWAKLWLKVKVILFDAWDLMFGLVFMDCRNVVCTYFIGYCTIPRAFHFWQKWAANRSWFDHYVTGMLMLLDVFVILQNYQLKSFFFFFWVNLFFAAFFFFKVFFIKEKTYQDIDQKRFKENK